MNDATDTPVMVSQVTLKPIVVYVELWQLAIVVAGLVTLILLILGFFYFRKRARRTRVSKDCE